MLKHFLATEKSTLKINSVLNIYPKLFSGENGSSTDGINCDDDDNDDDDDDDNNNNNNNNNNLISVYLACLQKQAVYVMLQTNDERTVHNTWQKATVNIRGCLRENNYNIISKRQHVERGVRSKQQCTVGI